MFFEDDGAADKFPNPVVQILTIKPMGAKTEGGAERYRLVVSDGEMFCQGMVATQSHHLIIEQQLETHKIVRIKQYQKNVINKKRFVSPRFPRRAIYFSFSVFRRHIRSQFADRRLGRVGSSSY